MKGKLLLLWILFLFVFGCKNIPVGYWTSWTPSHTGNITSWNINTKTKDYRTYQNLSKTKNGNSLQKNLSKSFASSKLSNTQSIRRSFEADSSTKTKGNIWFKWWADQDMLLFRENIKNWHIPNLDSITYNWIFSDYHFQQAKWKCEKMFCPLADSGKIKDQNRLQISLWSNIKDQDFKRPPTNFVIVIDKSGSMGWKISQYYYENTEKYIYPNKLCPQNKLYFKPWKKCIAKEEKKDYIQKYKEYSTKNKMTLTRESLSKITDKFREDDRIWIVLYDNDAYIAHKLIKIKNINKKSLKKHIKEIRAWGWTNMESGIKKWVSLFSEDKKSWYQNRIIFMTDAMPNIGDYSSEGLAKTVKEASEKSIHFSFFWVGVDFQQQFIQKIWNFKWNNYFFISDAWQFSQKIVEEFDYNFFPMIFNLQLSIDDENKIEKVYWLDNKWKEIINMKTLFPTPPTTLWHRWSIILLKLKEEIKDNIKLEIKYEKYNWKKTESQKQINLNSWETTAQSIKKWVILIKYVDALKKSIKKSDTSILKQTKVNLEKNKEIFEWKDKEILEKELETIDKLINLIESGEKIKDDYNPEGNKRNLKK